MTENKKHKYFDRWMRLKPAIERDCLILENIIGVLQHKYKRKDELPKNVVWLGGGEAHTLFNVGILNDLEIALRITRWPIRLDDTPNLLYRNPLRDIEEEIASYVEAFSSDRNPPYFCGVVSWEQYVALLTEDVSKCKKYPLKPASMTDFYRINDDGTKERFFLDPFESKCSLDDSAEYLSDSGRIIIPKSLWKNHFL